MTRCRACRMHAEMANALQNAGLVPRGPIDDFIESVRLTAEHYDGVSSDRAAHRRLVRRAITDAAPSD